MESQVLLKDLNEGDLFITKKGNEGQYLKKLDNDKYLLKNLKDNKEYELEHGNIPVFKKINKSVNIKCDNVFDDIKTYPDFYFNTIFSDVPYNLSSKWIIDKETGRFIIEGKPKDFMNKWDGFDENTLDLFFKESFRILKHGGFTIIYGIDRQLPAFQYYAVKNGFEIQQSLYWYFINSMPKGVDAGKMIDKRGGKNYVWFGKWMEKRMKELNLNQNDISKHFLSKTDGLTGRVHNWITGKTTPTIEQFNKLCELLSAPFDNIEELEREIIGRGKAGLTKGNVWSFSGEEEFDITLPASDLAKCFDSFKYGVAPFKQCVETIMIFHKPCKNGSVLNDLLSFNEDSTISPSVVNINENRVPINPEVDDPRLGGKGSWKTDKAAKNVYEGGYEGKDIKLHESGRYPAQVFVDNGTSQILNTQSGILKSGYMSPDKHKRNKTQGEYQSDRGIYGKFDNKYLLETYGDSGGCSRVLHKCDKNDEEFLISKQVEIRIDRGCRKIEEYIKNGYIIPKRKTKSNGIRVPFNTKIWIEVWDLPENSSIRIKYMCKYCNKIDTPQWRFFIKKEELFRCNSCEKKLFRSGDKNPMFGLTGETSPNWNSEKLEEDRIKKREGYEYNIWRKEIFYRDKYICQKCYKKSEGDLVAHHILPYSTYPEYRLYINNGITLCENCHKIFHSIYGSNKYLLYDFFEWLNPISRYEEGEHDLLNYCKKVSGEEKNAGLNEEKNKHICLKPISLNYRILNLFKLPKECDQKLYIPFAGVMSEVIGAIKSGYKEENIYACEINQEYVDIGKERLEYWREKFKNEKSIKKD